MFPNARTGASIKPQQKKNDLQKDHAVTILTRGCHFVGKLYCRGATRIGGKIEGEIISEGLLIIEEEAEIRANVRAEEAIIQGYVNGKIEAKTRVELCAQAIFNGDVLSPTLIVREGAQFNGRSTVAQAPGKIDPLDAEKEAKDADMAQKNAAAPVSLVKQKSTTAN